MHFFSLSIDKVLIRFFLMMTCVIVGVFSGQPLITILALPMFLSAILGVSFQSEEKYSAIKTMVKTETINQKQAA